MAGKRSDRKQVHETRAAYRERPAARRSPARTSKHTVPEWEWIQANRSWLEEEYAGRWIAVADGRVVGAGVKLSTAMRKAAKQGYDHPLVTAFKAAKYRGMAEVPLRL